MAALWRNNLVQRIVSAVFILVVAIPLTIWGGPAFWFLALVLVGAGWWEFVSMGRAGRLRPFAVVGGVAALGLCLLAVPTGPWRELALAVAFGALWLAAIARPDYSGILADLAYSTAGVVWLGWLGGYAIFLRDLPGEYRGLAWFLSAVAIVVAADTGAYVTGRAVGRHPMAPRVSPKKTAEGLAGGLLLAALAGYGAGQLGLHLLWWQGIVVGLAGGLASVLGDLAESLLKRQFGVKDSSHLIPGHGGVLDRVDGLLFALPAISACVILMQRG